MQIWNRCVHIEFINYRWHVSTSVIPARPSGDICFWQAAEFETYLATDLSVQRQSVSDPVDRHLFDRFVYPSSHHTTRLCIKPPWAYLSSSLLPLCLHTGYAVQPWDTLWLWNETGACFYYRSSLSLCSVCDQRTTVYRCEPFLGVSISSTWPLQILSIVL